MESIRPFVVPDAEIGHEEEQSDDPMESGSERLAYYIHQGPVMRIIRQAAERPHLEHVIVIDEINRGDISRIFGPLISALEPDKRAGAEFPVGFESQYPKAPALETRIFVPANLHVIGTMNSADRNIALVDHALRRRFDFVECPPVETLLPGPGEHRQIDLRLLLEAINNRVRYLIDRDHCVGHGYFMSCKDDAQIVECFARRIIPLLFEYFLGNEAQLLMVLGDRIGGPYNICKIARRDQTFDAVFGTDLESALDLGYRETEIHLSLTINERFWNPARLIPGPDDQGYAVNSLIKIYQPALNEPT
jgi:5-methylcytosine-specific restriction protein B